MNLTSLSTLIVQNKRFETSSDYITERNFINKLYTIIENGFTKIFDKKLFKTVPVNETPNKHVTFLDSLGMDLTMEHKINSVQTNDNQTITKYNHSIVPKFNLNNSSIYRNLLKNKICLSSVEIYNQVSIRGIILTLGKTCDKFLHKTTSNFTQIDNCFKHFKFKNNKRKLILNNLDLVYIIYSTDGWRTWKYQATLQKSCKSNNSSENIIKSHEFFIQNIDRLTLQLQLIVCHQINSDVFHDDNNNLGYNFDFVSSL